MKIIKKMLAESNIPFQNIYMINVLLVEEKIQLYRELRVVLPDEFCLHYADSWKKCIKLIRNTLFDVFLLSETIKDKPCFYIFDTCWKFQLHPIIIILSDEPDYKKAVKAIKNGATYYFSKKSDLHTLEPTIKEKLFLFRNYGVWSTKTENVSDMDRLLPGVSPALYKTKKLIEKYAKSTSPVLITGESGTGKELVAKAIHSLSKRKNGPLKAINCSAIPLSLVETELFGAVRGAYTDAVSRAGCFEQSNGGSLFLDEIGEMWPHAQAKLLRIIEEKKVTRIGGIGAINVDTRIIAATNQNLNKQVKSKKFREDLYYRINTLPLHLPPLRERREDIPFLCNILCKANNQPNIRFSLSALDKLVCYNWPGNIRELRNVIERSLLLAEGQKITASDIWFV